MRILLALTLLTVSACAPSRPDATAPPAAPAQTPADLAGVAPPAPLQPTVVLISIDGFRSDYLDRLDVEAPTLRMLGARGVRADRLVPVFPTKTFPNHYSLATGLYPEQHGVVGNSMRDPEMLDDEGKPMEFSMSDRAANTDARWWGGEPIWTTAERQGVRAGTVFWPGSEVDRPHRPTYWLPYDDDLSYSARVDTALAWMTRPGAERARLVTLYFSAVDSEGHRHGPDSPQVAAAIARVDSALARLLDGLRVRGLSDRVDFVVVSDHGMVEVSRERVVVLDQAIDVDAQEEIEWGEPVGIWPQAGADVDALVARLDALEHVRAYRKEDTPERLRYRAHRRIPPIVLIADDGWTVTLQDYLDRRGDRPSGGSHGFDNAYESMGGIFLAAGPHFVSRSSPISLRVVDVYGIVARVLGIEPAPNEGDSDRVLQVVR